MAKSQILWTILPYGMIESDNQQYQRVSVVASPRLTPEGTNEGKLGSFDDFINWPETVLKKMKFAAEIAGVQFDLKMLSEPDPEIWRRLFTQETPVAGFKFMDMSKVNLLSYPVRNILAYIRDIYGRMAEEHPLDYPSLLPWGDGILKDMLTEAGTREKVEDKRPVTFEPGYKRFFDKGFKQPPFSKEMEVPTPNAGDTGLPEMINMTLNVMDPDYEKQEKDLFKTQIEYDLYQADRFYRRVRPTEEELMMRRPDFKQKDPSRVEDPVFEFHRIIASFANYPELMRKLGLILDFVVVMPTVGLGEGRIKLKINWKPEHICLHSDVTPSTAFISEPEQKRFITASRTPYHKNGFLNLEQADDNYGLLTRSQFYIYQVDPDGAALKTFNTILTWQGLLDGDAKEEDSNDSEITYTTGDRQGLSVLRTGGLGVSQHRRALSVAADIAAMTAKNESLESGNGDNITLFAEDVLRGYRVDVATVPDRDRLNREAWRSLCAREGEYELIHTATNCVEKSGEKIALQPDEGYVSGPSTTSGGPKSSNPDDHYLHESLFRWTGWSLCTPRPGRIIVAEEATDGSQIQREKPGNIENEDMAANGSGVKASFVTAKGSLPRLRYGRLYRMRARIVDLAGNSLALDDDSNSEYAGASNAVGYWRFEPIDPPVVVHRTRVSEGESLERMVIRSNYDIGAQTYMYQPYYDAIRLQPDLSDFSYNEVNERHFVPPKSSQSQCETHGLFDPFSRDWETIRKSYEIAAHDERTLYDRLDGSDIEVITPSDLAGIATTTNDVPKLPDENNPTGDRMAGGQYVVHHEEQITTPWLPDGAAEGIAIRPIKGHDLPGVREEKELGPSCRIKIIPGQRMFVILVKNKGDWPTCNGFRLILAEVKPRLGPTEFTFADEPVWNESKRTLTFFVPKGWIVRLAYSSYAKEKEFIDSFGILNWMREGEKRTLMRDLALFGANWLLTPFRDLTLVHATQQPVYEPVFKDNPLVFDREPGSHDLKFPVNTNIHLHGPSTGKFEVEAEWTEWVDDLTKDGPELKTFKGQLGEIRLAENHRDDFTLKEAVDEQWADLVGVDTEKKQRADIHALGDTRFRLIKYRIRATTRFREYLPQPIYENQDLVTRLGPVATGEPMSLPEGRDNDPGTPILRSFPGSNQQSLVPSSAPPADPKVLYVVPTMRWGEKQNITDGYNVTRSGNGLRVWLDRPWFSSGDGELLGVVIYYHNQSYGDLTAIPKEFENFVTQWGSDPFWMMSYPIEIYAKFSHFPLRVLEFSEEVYLQETSNFPNNKKVMIAGHRVHFDNGKKLWYCDIELSSTLNNYMPFIRLALVRYQPNAIANAKISKVVLTDFAQVLPNRSVSVVRGEKLTTVSLSGPITSSGPMMRNNPFIPEKKVVMSDDFMGRNRVELVLQTRDPSIDSDLAWTDTIVLSDKITKYNLQDNIIFSANVSSAIGPLQRLMLREFERFYSDDVAPSRDPNITEGKRVVEERLVFSYIIPI